MDNKPSTLSGPTTDGHNGAEDPAKLRAEIAQTRNEMSGTIEQLHGRLNPVVFKDQALEQFHEATETVKQELKEHFQDAKESLMAEFEEVKGTVREGVLDEIDTVKSRLSEEIVQAKAAVREATIGKVENMMHGVQDRVRGAGRSARDVVADNPIPAALAGVGLAWLFIEGRRRRASRPRQNVRPEFQLRSAEQAERERIPSEAELEGVEQGEGTSIGRRIRDAGQQTGQKVADATQEAGAAVSRMAHQTKESVSDIAQRAQDKASKLSHGAGRQARRAQQRSTDLFRANPLAVGAALFAAGTIIGLAVPGTTKEDKWLGGARDDVVGKAQGLAHEAFEKAGEAVKRVGESDESQDESSAKEIGHEYH